MLYSGSNLLLNYIFTVCTKCFSRAPGLSITASAAMRTVTFEYLAYSANAVLFRHMKYDRFKNLLKLFLHLGSVAVGILVSCYQTSDKKSPCGSLMVRQIALA